MSGSFDIKKLLEGRAREAQVWLARKILEDCRPLTPIDTGQMVNTPVVEQDGTVIRYTVPYAREMYGGVMTNPPYKPYHYKSPTAVDHWFDAAKEIHGQEWIDGVRDILIGKGR